jgi:hypothetical protein
MIGKVIRFTSRGRFTIASPGSKMEYLATQEQIVANPERLKLGAECTFKIGRTVWPGEYAVATWIEF